MSWIRSRITAITSRDRHAAQGGLSLQVQNSVTDRTTGNGMEPAPDLKSFRLFWNDVNAILNKPINLNSEKSRNVKSSSLLDDCGVVIHFTEKMLKMLIDTDENLSLCCNSELLDFFYTEEVLDKLRAWSLQRPDYYHRLTLHQLNIYDALLSHSQQKLLRHKQFVKPLLNFLNLCNNHQIKEVDLERRFLLILHHLCTAIAQETDILAASFDDEMKTFVDLSLFVPYVHHLGLNGQQARDDLLLLLSLSSVHDEIGKFITEKTDFCQVFVVSLSGVYSSLPRTITYDCVDWNCITDDDICQNVDLQMFLNLLEFCNAVVQVSPPSICQQLLAFIYNGFLVSVIGPTLYQAQSGTEEAIAVTAYLELFIRKITEPYLLRTFLQFILLGKMEEISVLDSLILRINSSNTRLSLVTLTLFKTMVNLNCEEVMFQLIFKYLLPCTHIMLSQQRAVSDIDAYCKNAEKLISLIPSCCNLEKVNTISCSVADDDDLTKLRFNRRKVSVNDFTSDDDVLTPMQSSLKNVSLSESSYQDYLHMARNWIKECIEACNNWSALYDGESHHRLTKSQMRNADQSNSDVTKTDQSNSDVTKTVQSNSDVTKTDQSNSGVTKTDQSNSDVIKTVQSNTDVTKTDQSNSDITKNDQSNSDVTKTEQSNSDVTKTDQSNSDVTKNGQFNLLVTKNDQSNDSVMRGGESVSEFIENRGLKELEDAAAAAADDDDGSDHCDKISEMPKENGDTMTLSNLNTLNNEMHLFLTYLNRIQVENELSNEIVLNFENFLSDIKPRDFVETDAALHYQVVSDFNAPTFDVTTDTGVAIETTVQSPRITMDTVSATSVDNASHTPYNSDVISSDDVEIERNMIPEDGLQSPTRRFFDNMTSPTVGPFLTALLNKLEIMKQNSFHVNLQLTGLLTRLACYPQPLLTSLLLSHTLVFQPSVKSMIQVLNAVRCRIEEHLYKIKDKDKMLEQAYDYLQWRDSLLDDNKLIVPSRRHSFMTLPSNNTREKLKRKNSQLQLLENRRGAIYTSKKSVTKTSIEKETPEMVELKNAIYCAVVFKEFLKELAAISQEHALLLMENSLSLSSS